MLRLLWLRRLLLLLRLVVDWLVLLLLWLWLLLRLLRATAGRRNRTIVPLDRKLVIPPLLTLGLRLLLGLLQRRLGTRLRLSTLLLLSLLPVGFLWFQPRWSTMLLLLQSRSTLPLRVRSRMHPAREHARNSCTSVLSRQIATPHSRWAIWGSSPGAGLRRQRRFRGRAHGPVPGHLVYAHLPHPTRRITRRSMAATVPGVTHPALHTPDRVPFATHVRLGVPVSSHDLTQGRGPRGVTRRGTTPRVTVPVTWSAWSPGVLDSSRNSARVPLATSTHRESTGGTSTRGPAHRCMGTASGWASAVLSGLQRGAKPPLGVSLARRTKARAHRRQPMLSTTSILGRALTAGTSWGPVTGSTERTGC